MARRIVSAILLSLCASSLVSAQGVVILLQHKGGVAQAGGSPIAISTTSPLTACTEGINCTVPITATGGSDSNYVLSKPTGSFPAGCAIGSSTPPMTLVCNPPTIGTSPGTAFFTLAVTNTALQSSGNVSFQWTVSYGTPTITTTSLTAGVVGGTCGGSTLASQGGQAPRTYSVVAGAMPAGCSLNASTGAITGTPTESISASLTFQVTDALGSSSTKQLTLSINAAASSACDGADTNSYFLCLQNLNNGGTIQVSSWSMRSTADYSRLRGGARNAIDGFDYVYSTDTYPNKVDASKGVTVPMGNSISTPPHFPVDATSTGDVLITWDEIETPSFRIAHMVCGGSGTQPVEKSRQVEYIPYSGSGGAIGFEVRSHPNGDGQISSTEFAAADNTTPVGWNPPTAIPVSSVVASGTTATVTTSVAHGLTTGDKATLTGSTNVVQIPVTSCTSGTSPVCTTTAPHGLTVGQTFDVRFQGETPNVNGSTPADHYYGTVTGASTVSLVRPGSATTNFTSAPTGGYLEVFPYSRREQAVTVSDTTHFTIPLICDPTNCGGTNLGASVADTSGRWVVPLLSNGFVDESKLKGGTDCSTIDVRRYTKIGAHASGNYQSDHLRNQTSNFIQKCGVRTRYVLVFKLNQGAAWTCGAASGNYDPAYIYISSVGQSGYTLIHNGTRVEFDTLEGTNPATGERTQLQGAFTATDPVPNPPDISDTTDCGTYTDIFKGRCTPWSGAAPCRGPGNPYFVNPSALQGIYDFYWERNTSGGACDHGFAVPGIVYMWNQVVMKTSAGGISISPTSVVVNGTELLVPPVAP